MQKLTEANMYLYRSGVERTCTRDFFVPEGSQRCARVLGKRGLFVNLVGVANRSCVGNRKYVGTTFEIGKQGAKNVRNWKNCFAEKIGKSRATVVNRNRGVLNLHEIGINPL